MTPPLRGHRAWQSLGRAQHDEWRADFRLLLQAHWRFLGLGKWQSPDRRVTMEQEDAVRQVKNEADLARVITGGVK